MAKQRLPIQLLYTGGHPRLTHFCWLDLAGCYRLVCIQAAAVARFMQRLTMFSLFWHFLDLVWVCIFSIVYLMSFGVTSKAYLTGFMMSLSLTVTPLFWSMAPSVGGSPLSQGWLIAVIASLAVCQLVVQGMYFCTCPQQGQAGSVTAKLCCLCWSWRLL